MPSTKAGRKPDIQRDLLVKKLKEVDKLSFRAIAKMTGEDSKNVFLRYKRSLVNYPQTGVRQK